MKNKLFIKLAGVFVGLVLFLTSCDPAKKYASEIEEIDSCIVVLNEIEEKYNGIEFDSIADMVIHVMSNEDTIEKYYSPDTVDLEIGIRMNDCKGIRKSLKNVRQKEEQYGAEIEALKVQFENLREDILNGVLKENEIQDFLSEEKKDLENLNISFTEFDELQAREKRYYYASCPIIDALIVELKNDASEE